MRFSATGLHIPAVLSVLVLAGIGTACQRAAAPHGPSTESSVRAVKAEKERQQAANRAGRAIDAKDIRASEVRRVEELFAGRFAGVTVLQHAGGLSVRIRGTTSVLGSNEPLYVIDGMPIDAGTGGALVGLNPADIQRIEVLKDISSTSFYGMRGANGVVLITTKRAN
jgi:TonB-dependent SusC/RagA subfamily outer membrane receptor